MDGYICCFSNPSMPDLVVVRMTETTPDIALTEMNMADLPTPYKIEFAKKVYNASQKVNTIYAILEDDRVPCHSCRRYRCRNRKKWFFTVLPGAVRPIFDLMEGEEWRF